MQESDSIERNYPAYSREAGNPIATDSRASIRELSLQILEAAHLLDSLILTCS